MVSSHNFEPKSLERDFNFNRNYLRTFAFFQRTILDEYGESHYDALNHPHLYFQMLILTAQFEPAIEFLTRVARYKVHGVHMGIALHEMYMLLGPRDVGSPLSIPKHKPHSLRR